MERIPEKITSSFRVLAKGRQIVIPRGGLPFFVNDVGNVDINVGNVDINVGNVDIMLPVVDIILSIGFKIISV